MKRNRRTNAGRAAGRGIRRAMLGLCAMVLMASALAAEGAPGDGEREELKSIPASRAAKNVAVIPIHGEIDRWTPNSVKARIEASVRDGADALVFEINSPGGDLSATLATCALIKSAGVENTVAWVRSDAYSGGAILALACREMVVTEAATIGDALPVQVNMLRMLQELPDAEREKILGPLIAEVVDSARRNGYDEMLVQGFVRRGVELWLVEHEKTGAKVFVTAGQYAAAVGSEPGRTAVPAVPSATGGEGKPMTGGVGGVGAGVRSYEPAAPDMSQELVAEVGDQLAVRNSVTQRPNLESAEHQGMYREVEYVSDGHGLIILKTSHLTKYGIASAVVNDEAELKSYFGAEEVRRVEPAWSEGLVRFLTNPIVRGVLIVIFLVCLFLESTHPGVVIPGLLAGAALLALLIPPILVDMASWWEVGAIVVGLGLVMVEVFVTPGLGVAGVLGMVLLFGGLIGTFVGQTSGIFPSSPAQSRELTWGVMTVLVAFLTSTAGVVALWRALPGLPVLGRLMHKDVTGSETEGLLSTLAANNPVVEGERGVALTPLRPTGRGQFGERVIDVWSEGGMVEAGTRVKVTRVEGMRVVVERCVEGA